MREHQLKTWPEFFQPIWIGDKRFEIRMDDRNYRRLDNLTLREWSNAKGYSGRAVRATVTHILGGPLMGLQEGYVAMSLRVLLRVVNYPDQKDQP